MILPVRPHFLFDLLLPDNQREEFIIPVPARSSDSPTILEQCLLIAAGRIAGVEGERGVFEFGTYKGATALMLSANFGPQAHAGAWVRTLDLDPRQSDGLLTRGMGIERLQGHSVAFDFSPYYGTSALVFIDGGHDWPTVISDQQNALTLLPGSHPGVIVWHDYSDDWPGVQKAVEEFAREGRVYHIEDTKLAVHFVGMEGL